MKNTTSKLIALAAGAATATALTGCSIFGSSVPADEVEEKVAEEVESQTGTAVTVDCPEDLEAEEGATLECELTSETEQNTVEVTVDSVDDGTVNYSFLVVSGDHDGPEETDDGTEETEGTDGG